MNTNKKGFTLIEMIFAVFGVLNPLKPYIHQWFPVFHFCHVPKLFHFFKIICSNFIYILLRFSIVLLLNGFVFAYVFIVNLISS